MKPSGRRVLVMRSAQQASALAAELRAQGLDPVVIPAIEIAPPHSFAELDRCLSALSEFDWLILTSANAVEAFARRANALGVQPSPARVAAIGAATAKALEALGFAPAIVPPQATAESLTAALLPYARKQGGRTTRFLLVRAEEARELLPETLRAAGAEVVVAPAYRTVLPAGSVQAMRELFAQRENWPDAITFTSSSSVRNLLALLAAAGLALPPEIPRVSIGPITSQTLREADLAPHCEAAEATVAALADACRELIQPLQP